jgi:cysteine desulfurase
MIYLDYHATTPCDPRVVEALLPYFTEQFANPSSATHKAGKTAAIAAEQARDQVAELIGADPKEIIFTSGATESNNLAIIGLAQHSENKRRKIVTSAIEHKAILAPGKHLEKFGFELVALPVDSAGRVDKAAALEAVDDNTFLVSIQAANNEIGTIQDIPFFAHLAHGHGSFFHIDAAQAVGKIPVDIVRWDVDLLSISAHKLYGPKGIGALFMRGGPYAIPIEPLVHGGGQESDIRPGTMNIPGIVGLGVACSICLAEMSKEASRVTALRDQLEMLLSAKFPNLIRNGDLDHRLPGNSSLTFHGIDAETLIANVPELSLSTGSACTSGTPAPSHVLLAIGLSRDEAHQTIRIGLGRFSTETDIQRASDLINKAIARIRSLSS